MNDARKQQSGTARLEEIKHKAEGVRAREEARLIKLAQAAGYFDKRALSKDVRAMFDAFVAEQGPKQSQLTRLNKEVKTMAARQSQEERRLDTRRKILLGSFLIAQFEHKPALLAQMHGEIEQFLDQHKDKAVAEANKAILSQWLKNAPQPAD